MTRSAIASSTTNNEAGLFFPLLLWGGAQVAILAVAAFRVPLWGQFQQPGEMLAAPSLAIVQIYLGAALMPWLADVRTAAACALAAWPLMMIASAFAQTPPHSIIFAECCVIVWVAFICLGNRLQAPLRQIAWIAALAWTLGGPILLYLRVEFAGGDGPLSAGLCGPALVTSHLLTNAGTGNDSGVPLAAAVAIALFFSLNAALLRNQKQNAVRLREPC